MTVAWARRPAFEPSFTNLNQIFNRSQQSVSYTGTE
jgi:hypothetical protein